MNRAKRCLTTWAATIFAVTVAIAWSPPSRAEDQPAATQPTAAAVSTELYSLITDLSGCGGGACPAARTQTITMAACTAILSSATTLLK